MRSAVGRRTWRAWAESSIWPAQCAVVVLALAAALRWVLTDSVVPWDSKNQFHAFFRFLAASLHDGTSPFWNPYHYGGHPSIADPQSLVFQPAFLAWAWFDSAPALWVVDLLVLAHLVAGALAVVWLGHKRGWPSAASILAAAIFMLGGAVSGRLNHTGIIVAYGLFPVAVAAIEAAMARRSLLLAVASGFVVATILTSRNQVALLLMAGIAAWALAWIASQPRPLAYFRERLGVLTLTGIVTAVLSAIPLLLTLQLAALSNRPAATLADANEGSLYPPALVAMAVPNVFGAHAPNWGYWGPNWARLPEVAATDESFTYVFVGAVPILLICWFGIAGGLLLGRGRLLLMGIAASLLFALGQYTPLFPWAFEHIPGISFFRRPVDGLFLTVIAVALAAGYVLAQYIRRGLPKPDPLMTAVVIAGSIAILAGAVSYSARFDHGIDAAGEIAKSLLLTLACAGALAWGHATGRREMAAAAAVVVACAELLVWNAGSRLNAEPRQAYEMFEQASGEDAKAMALLTSEFARRQRRGARPRVEVIGLGGPWQNIAMVLKLEATTGYNPLRIGAYDKFVSPGERPYLATSRRFPPTFDGYECALARSLDIEYLVLDRPLERMTNLQRRPIAEPLMAGPKIWIYRLRRGLPRARFTSDLRIADLDEVTRSGGLANQPALGHALIDDDTPPKLRLLHRVSLRLDQRAKIMSWSPGRIVIGVDAPEDGALVLNDLYYPGWVAEVDGEPSPVLRADVLFRAVQVPAGSHVVELRFEPLRWDNLWHAARQVFGPH